MVTAILDSMELHQGASCTSLCLGSNILCEAQQVAHRDGKCAVNYRAWLIHQFYHSRLIQKARFREFDGDSFDIGGNTLSMVKLLEIPWKVNGVGGLSIIEWAFLHHHWSLASELSAEYVLRNSFCVGRRARDDSQPCITERRPRDSLRRLWSSRISSPYAGSCKTLITWSLTPCIRTFYQMFQRPGVNLMGDMLTYNSHPMSMIWRRRYLMSSGYMCSNTVRSRARCERRSREKRTHTIKRVTSLCYLDSKV